MNEPFTVLRSIAIPLDRRNVDTDQIVPARFLSRTRAEGFEAILFRDLRFDAKGREISDFIVNQAPYRAGKILIARENFGSGSSRESAVYALWDYGIRSVIAPSFGDIFYSNALKNGLLPVVLPEPIVAQLLESCLAHPGSTLTIDLDQQEVLTQTEVRHHFDIDPFSKQLLLTGEDELTYTLGLRAEIEAYEQQRAKSLPWL